MWGGVCFGFPKLLLLYVVTIILVQSQYEPVSMDIEWIIQGGDFASTGFVLEMLGIGNALKIMLPRLRVVKSYYNNSLDEDAISFKFLNTLFPEERETILTLTEKFHRLNIINTIKFQNISRVVDDSVCLKHNKDDGVGFLEMARPLVSATTVAECCKICVADPLCIAWSFGCGQQDVCILHGGTMKLKEHSNLSDSTAGYVNNCVQSAILPGSYQRLPAPRALVFHGTSCDYRNQTISKLPRDINTVWIGRFMLERGGEIFSSGGLGREEMEVLKCASVMDEVWVPTAWNRDSMIATAKQINLRLPNIVVIPEAVDTLLFDPGRGSDVCENLTVNKTSVSVPFQFLSVFKWEYRKGWDILLTAYWSAFGVNDEVTLRLHTYRPSFLSGQDNITENLRAYAWEKFGKKLEELAPVITGDTTFEGKSPVLSRIEMRDLYRQSDAFVLPTRGEGWCLPVAEAMAMGMPVIVSNFSGPAAYANDSNAYMIPVSPTLDGYADADVNTLIRLMRDVYINRSEAFGKGQAARRTMQSMTPEIIVNSISDRLLALVGMRGWGV